MSINAFRIVKIETAKNASFNPWHDQSLMDYLLDHTDFYASLNSDGAGVSEIAVTDLEEAVSKSKELKLDGDTVKAINKDINWARKRGDEFVAYYLY
jgi:hypothetical protein